MWGVIGAISQRTERLVLGTGVTCPTVRIHPAIIAQAAATAATLMPGRFFLGVGTGENLNEHILGDKWPPADVRLEMLEESIEVMRLLWQGGSQSHDGDYYVVENARIYDLPDEPIKIMVAASGRQGGRAGRARRRRPDQHVARRRGGRSIPFNGGNASRPVYGQMTVSWAETKDDGRQDGAGDLAERRRSRRAVAGAATAGALRAGIEERDARADQGGDRVRA